MFLLASQPNTRKENATMNKQILESAQSAIIPKEEYDVFTKEIQEKSKRLQETAQKFKIEQLGDAFICEYADKFLNLHILPQGQYTDVPFRMEEYDQKSTVASSGCAILVAKALGHVFNGPSFSVKELATAAVEKGYRGYRKKEDGSWISMGCRHVIFDRFVPSLYGLNVERADSVYTIFEALKAGRIPVLLVSNKVYKDDPVSADSHFIVLLGYKQDKVTVWDSEVAGTIEVPYDRVIPAIRVSWLFAAE